MILMFMAPDPARQPKQNSVTGSATIVNAIIDPPPLAEPAYGTSRISGDVRSRTAVGGIADMSKQDQVRRFMSLVD